MGGDAFFKYYISVLFFPDYIFIVFLRAPEIKESGAMLGQSGVLCMGRTEICFFDADIHYNRICGGIIDG